MRYQEILEACWTGYRQAGMKKKGDRQVPNCVPVEEVKTGPEITGRDLLFKAAAMAIRDASHEGVSLDYEQAIRQASKLYGIPYQPSELPRLLAQRAEIDRQLALLKQGKQVAKARRQAKRAPTPAGAEEYWKTHALPTDRIKPASKTLEAIEEDLKKWFKEKWVRFGPDGRIRGDCARGSEGEGKPKCLPQSKAHSLGKKGRASAAAKKRREDPDPERRGPARNVATRVKEDNNPKFAALIKNIQVRMKKDDYQRPDLMKRVAQMVKQADPTVQDAMATAQQLVQQHGQGPAAAQTHIGGMKIIPTKLNPGQTMQGVNAYNQALGQAPIYKVEEQYTDDDDWYDDEDQETELRSGDYVRDQMDGEHGEVFRMQGDPYERRVRILDRDGKGWYIEPNRLTRVDPQDPDVQRYFGKKRQSMDEFDASGYDRYSIYMDDYDLKEKFADLDDAIEAIEEYKRDDPKSRYADYNVRDLDGKVVWRNDAWQDTQKPGKIQFLPPKIEARDGQASTDTGSHKDAPMTQQQWMQSMKQQYPGVKFSQNKTTMQIFAMAPGKGKVGTFDPRQQVKEFTQADVIDPVHQTDTPPRRAYSIVLDGRPGQKYRAEQAWRALTSVFPKDYPGQAAEHKISEVAKKGSAIVKTGIASEDIAQTYVSKLSKFVPAENWRIVGGRLAEATGDDKFDAMMGRISQDPWTQLNSDPNWQYEIEELVDQHIEPWLLAMERSSMPITRDNETLNPGWRKRYEQISTQLAQKYLASKKFNPRDPDLVGRIRAAIDSHTDQSRNVAGQLSAYADDLPMHRYADAFDADGQTANIRDAMAGLRPGDDEDDDDGYAPRPRPDADPRRLDPGNMEEAIVASGPSRPLDDRAIRKMVWDTMKINADTGEQALQRALAVLAKKPQSRMVQDLQDKFQNLADRLAQGVAEGWSDAIVARRTGSPRTPYSVYIKGKKWKDFENEDLARAVMNKLKAKFRADGRDPETVTIAPTNMSETSTIMSALKQVDEKQDACYSKVKSRYKVWPSAYASGALVQCRKKGAANWGNKGKK